jgi:hypothetical protein
MWHKNRVWRVADVADLNDLVEKLTHHTWTACTGFRWEGLVLLNDSLSGDDAQEYAVVRDGRQVESLTVTWFDSDADLAATIESLRCAGSGVDMGPGTYREHAPGSCASCA